METWLREPSVATFRDRRDAGRLLGRALLDGDVLGGEERVLVVGLARGGVEVAAEVAEALRAPLDAVAVRKIGHPWQPEYGIGAVAPGGVVHLRAGDGLTEVQLAAATAAAVAAADELDARLHESLPAERVDGVTCVLVDDGLATGGTMAAAVRWACANDATRIVVAVPVGASASVRALECDDRVDAVICLETRSYFGAVGLWYDDFRQVSDREVRGLLTESRRAAVRSAERERVRE